MTAGTFAREPPRKAAVKVQSAATSVSAGCMRWFSMTEFKVREYKPNVPELNKSSFAGMMSVGSCSAPAPELVMLVGTSFPASK